MPFAEKKNEVKNFLLRYQATLCKELEQIDGHAFAVDNWSRDEGGGGCTQVLVGDVIEKGGVNFSHVFGKNLPISASKIRPELNQAAFDAMGVSSVIHPKNPFAPTAHLNIRLFIAYPKDKPPVWWFGGGFDLTPYYPFEEDCVAWHQCAKALCVPFGELVYPQYKKNADEYFYLPHRKEYRGVGGLFFDDLNTATWGWDFSTCFTFLKAVGQGFIDAYIPLLTKRLSMPYNEMHKDFQAYRRGRYVEFNLIYDRGTLFGLQSNGRTESILMSLPPNVSWGYQWEPEPDSIESRLSPLITQTRDWV